MRIGIIGLSLSGKRTFFQLLTGQRAPRQGYSHFEDIKIGKAEVQDPQLEIIADVFRVNNIVPSSFEVVLFPTIDCESLAKIDLFRVFESCDLLCHVVRCFSQEEHPSRNRVVDPQTDIEQMFELLMSLDFKILQQRLKILKDQKLTPKVKLEKNLLLRLSKALQSKELLVGKKLKSQEEEILQKLNCITAKPFVLVLNADDDVPQDKKKISSIMQAYTSARVKVMESSLRMETELSLIEESQREDFLQDLSIQESAFHRLLRLCYELLGLKTFCTLNQNELRVWIEKKDFKIKEVVEVFDQADFNDGPKVEVVSSRRIASSLKGEALPSKVWDAKDQNYIIKEGDVVRVRFKGQ